MNENSVIGESFVPEVTTTRPETTFEIEATEIEDDVKKRQKELGQETKKIIYRSLCLFFSLMFYYYLSKLGSTVFYVFRWGRVENPLVIPNWLERLNGKVSVSVLDEAQLGNMRVMLIDDPEASLASVALASPTGYFQESPGNYPGGVNYRLATRVLLDQMSSSTPGIARSGEVEPEVTYWSLQTEDNAILPAIKSLWKSFAGTVAAPLKTNLSQLLDFE